MDYKAKYAEAKEHGYSDTEIAQHLGGAKYKEAIESGHSDADIIKHFTGIDVGKSVLKADEQGNAPIDNKGLATGTPQQQIDFERGGFNKFSTSPVGQRLVENTNEAVGGVGMGMLGGAVTKGTLKLGGMAIGKAAKAVLPSAPKVGQVLESVGSKGQNYAAGLRESTVRMMTKSGENPGDVGKAVGAHLAENRIVGATPKETFDNLLVAKEAAGKAVGKAVADIHGNGAAAIDATEALNPLAKAIEKIGGAATSARRKVGKPFKEIYDSLQKQSKETGKLSLDHIRDAMAEIGPMTHKGAEETQAAMSELYGTLANVQDKIVTTLAKATNKPELREALLGANKDFSLYSRIFPDLQRAAAKESVGKSSFLAHPLEAAKHFAATKASGMMTRQGLKMQQVAQKAASDFPMSDTNKAALDQAMRRLKGAH